MTKVVENTNQAVRDIPDGATVMIGGFGGSGAPIELINSLIDRFIETGSPKNLPSSITMLGMAKLVLQP